MIQTETTFIDPGQPWQNGIDESFKGMFRDQYLATRVRLGVLESEIFL